MIVGARVNILPLESRVVLIVFGLRHLSGGGTESGGSGDTPRYIREEVGWAAVQCYSHDRYGGEGRGGSAFMTLRSTKKMFVIQDTIIFDR